MFSRKNLVTLYLLLVSQVLFCRNTLAVDDHENFELGLNSSPEQTMNSPQQQQIEADSSIRSEWEKLHNRLFGDEIEELNRDEVRLILMRMVQLEDTEIFNEAKRNFGSDLKTTIGQFTFVERFIRAHRLNQNPNYGLTKTLLRTFRIDANNCLEHRLTKFDELVQVMKNPTISNVIESNYKAQLKSCWLRFINTFNEMTKWIGSEDLEAIDDLMEDLHIPNNEFLGSPQETMIQVPVLTKKIAAYLRDTLDPKQSPLQKDIFNENYMSLFHVPCNELQQQTNPVMKRLIKWLSSLGDINTKHDFIKAHHYKLINRYRLCTQIIQTKSLKSLVPDQLTRREFWKGHKKRKVAKEKLVQLLKLPNQQTIRPTTTLESEHQFDLNYEPFDEIPEQYRANIPEDINQPNLITTQLPPFDRVFERSDRPTSDIHIASKKPRLTPLESLRDFEPIHEDQSLHLNLSLGSHQPQLSSNTLDLFGSDQQREYHSRGILFELDNESHNGNSREKSPSNFR